MTAHPIRSFTITLLLFAAGGLVIAAAAWSRDDGGETSRVRMDSRRRSAGVMR